jgi:peptide/nickel transport system substrate-binding protein
MRPRRGGLALPVMALVALIVAGCGGGSSNSGGTTSADTKVPEQVKMAWSGQIISLDPQIAQNPQDNGVLHLIGGGLWRSRNGETTRDLAASSKLSADERTLTVKLRPGLKFSDGTPLSAKDVAASILRIKTEKKAWFAGLLDPIDAIETPDDTTVVFKLARPYPSLPDVLAEPGFMVLPAKRLSDRTFFRLPVSAGPYKLVSWGGGSRTAVLKRNDLYSGSPPVVNQIDSVTIGDFQARLAQLRSGQIDISTDAPPSLLPQLKSLSGVDTRFTPNFGYYYMSSWDQRPPLNDVNVRKAIAAAIDRKAISDRVFDGEAPVTKGMWPSTMQGYEPSLPDQYDPGAAKELLKGTACESGCSLTLRTSSEALPWGDQTALMIQSDLKKIGINVKILNLDVNSWAAESVRDFQLALSGQADFADIPDTIGVTGLDINGGTDAAYSGLTMPGARALTSRLTASTGTERKQLLNDTNAFFLRYQPYYPLVDSGVIYSTRVPLNVMWADRSSFIEVATEQDLKAGS